MIEVYLQIYHTECQYICINPSKYIIKMLQDKKLNVHYKFTVKYKAILILVICSTKVILTCRITYTQQIYIEKKINEIE